MPQQAWVVISTQILFENLYLFKKQVLEKSGMGKKQRGEPWGRNGFEAMEWCKSGTNHRSILIDLLVESRKRLLPG